MSDLWLVDGPSLRKLLHAVLPTASDLESFCSDCFPDVAAKFASGQNRVERENLLLQTADGEQLVAALAKWNPRRFARYKRLLLLPRSAAGEAAKNPYRGLSAFQVEETDLFFGRDELTERLWQRFHALCEQAGSTRLLVVLGPSGSGKSSVARAGLLAELKISPIPGPEPVRCIVFKPGDSPLGALAIALLPPSQESATAAELSAQRDLADVLRTANGRGEFDGLSLWAANRPDVERSPFVALVDQFEEIYTLCPDKDERDAFVGVLLHASASRSRHMSVVLTLRSDFLGETHHQHPELNRLISDQAVIVSAMSRDELRQVIAEPAAQASKPLDDATIELLLSQALGNEGTLPLLEFALTRIWEGMRIGQEPGETLCEIGGVGGALAGKAQEIFDNLDEAEQETAKRALVRLVRLGDGTRDTRRRAPISELCGRGEAETHVLDLLRKFASEHARLVTLSGDGAETLAEVTHEALFDHWVSLRAWTEQGRKDRGLYDRALDAAKLWQQAGRPSGRLWRSPDLDLLRDYQRRKPEDFGPLAAEFLAAAELRQSREHSLTFGGLAALIGVLIVAVGIYITKERRIHQQLLDAYVERGRQLVFESGNPSEGLLWLHRAQAEGSTNPALSDLLGSALHAIGSPRALLTVQRFCVNDAKYSPDGRRILTACSNGTVRVWEVETGLSVAELKGHLGRVLSSTYSPDGRRILTASSDKTARLWEADSGRLLVELRGHRDEVVSATYRSDGRRIVTASDDHTARVWEADSGRLLAELKGHGDKVVGATYSPDGNRIVTASLDNTARVWEPDRGELVAELKGHRQRVMSARYSPDGSRIVTASLDGIARVWEATNGHLTAELWGYSGPLWSAAYSPDGHHIVTAGEGGRAQVWAADTARLLNDLKGHGAAIQTVTYSPNGRQIVTVSWDKTARVWEADTGRLLVSLKEPGGSVMSATYSPNSRHIVTTGTNKTVRVWEANSGRTVAELRGHTRGVVSAMYSPDGRRIVTTGFGDFAREWEADDGRLVSEFKGHGDNIHSSSYSHDGRRIVTTSGKNTARVWEAYSGRLVAELRGHWDYVVSASFSPDGRRIVTASWDRTARVWEANSGQLISVLEGHAGHVEYAAYSPDGRCIVTASADATARVWEANSGQLVAVLKGHEEGVQSAAYSPDGNRIVTASLDRTARVWEPNSGGLVTELKGHEGGVRSATYSPDGHRIVTASTDNTARVWEANTGRLLAELKGHGDSVNSATYSPDGRRVVTASSDRTARVWDVSPETQKLEQLTTIIRCHLPVRFDPNNKNLIIPYMPAPQDCPNIASLP